MDDAARAEGAVEVTGEVEAGDQHRASVVGRDHRLPVGTNGELELVRERVLVDGQVRSGADSKGGVAAAIRAVAGDREVDRALAGIAGTGAGNRVKDEDFVVGTDRHPGGRFRGKARATLTFHLDDPVAAKCPVQISRRRARGHRQHQRQSANR